MKGAGGLAGGIGTFLIDLVMMCSVWQKSRALLFIHNPLSFTTRI